ncbi:hypothetical protein Tco_0216163 [Tanacetum coccineum]
MSKALRDQRKAVKASSNEFRILRQRREIRKTKEEARLFAITKLEVIKVVREEYKILVSIQKRQSPPKMVKCLRKLRMLNMPSHEDKHT